MRKLRSQLKLWTGPSTLCDVLRGHCHCSKHVQLFLICASSYVMQLTVNNTLGSRCCPVPQCVRVSGRRKALDVVDTNWWTFHFFSAFVLDVFHFFMKNYGHHRLRLSCFSSTAHHKSQGQWRRRLIEQQLSSLQIVAGGIKSPPTAGNSTLLYFYWSILAASDWGVGLLVSWELC